jgi:isopenicillin N synthase-like dioxygenase
MLVQELAAKVQQPPSRYVQPEQYHPVSLVVDAEKPEPIPVIDLSRLLAADGADHEGSKLRLALQSWGLFLVDNHEIETSLMDDLISASREFFHLPLEEKQRCSNLIDGKHFQVEGYGNDPVASKDQTLDWLDRLHLRVEPEDERNLVHWPEHPNSFRALLHDYTLNCKRIKDRILRAMAKVLGLNEDYIVSQFSNKAPSFARFNYYPPCPRPDLVFGVKPHSDSGVLTILLMDKDVGGLQVLRNGIWHNVPTSPHRLLINVGDFAEIMSNGIFKSPVHRAVTNAGKERISLAMFHGLDPEKEIEPATALLHEKQPARYRKIKAKEYLAGFYEHFCRGTRFIDSVKI